MLDEQDDYRDQTKHPAIARLGRFSAHLPSAPDGDLTPDVATAQLRVQIDQLEVPPKARCSAAPRSPSKDCCGPGSRRGATCPCPCRVCPYRGRRACPGRLPDPCALCHPACRVGLATRRAARGLRDRPGRQGPRRTHQPKSPPRRDAGYGEGRSPTTRQRSTLHALRPAWGSRPPRPHAGLGLWGVMPVEPS